MRANEWGKEYEATPKTAGLWVRVQMRDGSRFDGVVENDLLKFPTKGSVTVRIKGGSRSSISLEAILSMQVLQVIKRPKRCSGRK